MPGKEKERYQVAINVFAENQEEALKLASMDLAWYYVNKSFFLKDEGISVSVEKLERRE